MGRPATKEERKEMARQRLGRLRRLRELGAPLWIVKSEQVAMVLNRAGMKNVAPGRKFSRRQSDLWGRHVVPVMGAEDVDED